MCLIPLNLIFSLFPLTTAKSCSGGLVLFGSSERKVIQQTEIITTTLIKNVYLIATKKTYNARKQHAGPERGGGENRYKNMYIRLR